MFEFNQSLFFWTLINFIILVLLVHRFALPSFFRQVDEAEEKRNAVLSDLEKSRQEANKLLESYQLKMASVEEEVHSILKEAKSKADSLVQQELANVAKYKQQLLEDVKREIESEKMKFSSELQVEVVSLILSSARKVIGRELTLNDHETIIREDVEDFKRVFLKK
jgi:F-type H+-transporting ATPase subunit b